MLSSSAATTPKLTSESSTMPTRIVTPRGSWPCDMSAACCGVATRISMKNSTT